jgi:hypothetical protein
MRNSDERPAGVDTETAEMVGNVTLESVSIDLDAADLETESLSMTGLKMRALRFG